MTLIFVREFGGAPHVGVAPRDLACPGLPPKSALVPQCSPQGLKCPRKLKMSARRASPEVSRRSCRKGFAPEARRSEEMPSGTPWPGEHCHGYRRHEAVLVLPLRECFAVLEERAQPEVLPILRTGNRPYLRWIAAVGPVGTVKKPSVLCEVFFKPLWESAFFADFHQRRQFPQALVSLSFLLLFSFWAFSTRKFCARIA